MPSFMIRDVKEPPFSAAKHVENYEKEKGSCFVFASTVEQQGGDTPIRSSKDPKRHGDWLKERISLVSLA